MYKFICHVHCRPGIKIVNPDSLSGRLGEEKSGIDAHFFGERQLLGLKNDKVGEEEDAEVVELEGIDMTT